MLVLALCLVTYFSRSATPTCFRSATGGEYLWPRAAVSVLRNVEIWPCRERRRNSPNDVSALPLRSSGTVFQTTCARPPYVQRTVSAWILNQRRNCPHRNRPLPAGLQPSGACGWYDRVRNDEAVQLTSQASLFFGRPFVKRFALCYQTVVCLSVCL